MKGTKAAFDSHTSMEKKWKMRFNKLNPLSGKELLYRREEEINKITEDRKKKANPPTLIRKLTINKLGSLSLKDIKKPEIDINFSPDQVIGAYD